MLENHTTWITGEGLVPFLRGVPFLSFHQGRAIIHRLDPSLQDLYPVNTWAHARSPAGSRLEFLPQTHEVKIRLRYVEIGSNPKCSLWTSGEPIAAFDPHGSSGDCEFWFTVPKTGVRYTLYFPTISVIEVIGIWPADALEPAPLASSIWLAYGDSITHGWHNFDPGLTYPAITSRNLGIDHYNLGFGGAARGEASVASSLGSISCDLITLAFGTNIMRIGWYDEATWRELFRTFIELVRLGHPDTPIAVISPIFRTKGSGSLYDAMGDWSERTPNIRGMTQVMLRIIEEDVVRAKAELGDTNLHLVSGLSLLNEEDIAFLSDGVHPNDAGMQLISERLTPQLAVILR